MTPRAFRLALMLLLASASTAMAQKERLEHYSEREVRFSAGPAFLAKSHIGIDGEILYEARFAKHFSWTLSGTVLHYSKHELYYTADIRYRYQILSLRTGVNFCPFWNEYHHLSLGISGGPGVLYYLEEQTTHHGAAGLSAKDEYFALFDMPNGSMYAFDWGLSAAYLCHISPSLAVGLSAEISLNCPATVRLAIAKVF